MAGFRCGVHVRLTGNVQPFMSTVPISPKSYFSDLDRGDKVRARVVSGASKLFEICLTSCCSRQGHQLCRAGDSFSYCATTCHLLEKGPLDALSICASSSYVVLYTNLTRTNPFLQAFVTCKILPLRRYASVRRPVSLQAPYKIT